MIRKPSHADGHGGNECDALPTGGDEPVGESHPRKTLHNAIVLIANVPKKNCSQPLPFAKWSKWGQCRVRRWHSRRTLPALVQSNARGTRREALWPLGSFPGTSWIYLRVPFYCWRYQPRLTGRWWSHHRSNLAIHGACGTTFHKWYEIDYSFWDLSK